MSTSVVTLSRQVGLMREMDTIANNIANAATAGYRREGVLFTEYVRATRGGESLSMAAGRARNIDLTQGDLRQTGGAFDLAIEGEGFFLVETPAGERLTRAGSFTPNAAGDLVTDAGHRLLDAGGAPVFAPPDARDIAVARDGTMTADGAPVARIGLYRPVDPAGLVREAGALFRAEDGVEPVLQEVAILQGRLEGSNVDPVLEIARMIEVQRAYELGQAFLERESDRRTKLIDTLTR
ncbi:MAG: flagellar hook-basal body complex protein [Deinococcus-Thermus bacterium]|jgi:flagellar basal-body rod protein FlgF|nr:flagellar hook-basal body complex protein [Deinococcota bacterium]